MDQDSDGRNSRVSPGGSDGTPVRPRAADAPARNTDPLASIGDYLAGQRQLRGISRDELCQLTRIPMRSLERLESGAFDTLDDGFVRGFVLTVAQALGLDPDDTLARMSREPAPESKAPRSLALTGMFRLGVLLSGLALVLVSMGLVRIAIDAIPGSEESSQVVLRRDPVRALAEASGVPLFGATETLVPATPRPRAIQPGFDTARQRDNPRARIPSVMEP